MVADAFLIFNLSERPFFREVKAPGLETMVTKCVNRIADAVQPGDMWQSGPPFGGAIDHAVYPTAVVIRALLAHHLQLNQDFLAEVSTSLLESTLGRSASATEFPVRPFWGELLLSPVKPQCFVLIPFSPQKLTDIYRRYVKSPIEEQTQLRCIRADDIYRSRLIMNDVWHQINSAAIVIADLTNKNPNVFYELGMAHVLGKPTILISQNLDDVPFDLRGVRTIIYNDGPAGYERLAQAIVKFVKAEVGGE